MVGATPFQSRIGFLGSCDVSALPLAQLDALVSIPHWVSRVLRLLRSTLSHAFLTFQSRIGFLGSCDIRVHTIVIIAVVAFQSRIGFLGSCDSPTPTTLQLDIVFQSRIGFLGSCDLRPT